MIDWRRLRKAIGLTVVGFVVFTIAFSGLLALLFLLSRSPSWVIVSMIAFFLFSVIVWSVYEDLK